MNENSGGKPDNEEYKILREFKVNIENGHSQIEEIISADAAAAIESFRSSMAENTEALDKVAEPLRKISDEFEESFPHLSEASVNHQRAMLALGQIKKIDWTNLPVDRTAKHTADTADAVRALVKHSRKVAEDQVELASKQEEIAVRRHNEQMAINSRGVNWAKYAFIVGTFSLLISLLQAVQSFFQAQRPIQVESKIDLRDLENILQKKNVDPNSSKPKTAVKKIKPSNK